METITRRSVPAGAPISVPAGAVSSPFAMARAYAGDRIDLDREDPEPPALPAEEEKPIVKETSAGRGSRGPNVFTRGKETLKACGPLSIEQFAKALDVEVGRAEAIADGGIGRGYWTRELGGERKLVPLTTPARQSGFKRHLAKKAGAAAKKTTASKPRTLPPAPAPVPSVPPPEQEAQFGLFNTGEFRIEYAGQEMKLPRKVTKAMVTYLLKIDAALDAE